MKAPDELRTGKESADPLRSKRCEERVRFARPQITPHWIDS